MRESVGEKIFSIVNTILLVIIGLTCFLPVLHVVSISLSGFHAINSGSVGLWPVGFTMENYFSLIKGSRVVGAFKNSVVITVIGTLVCMIATILAAYPLSRKYFYARRFFMKFVIFTMLFSGGMIPSYLIINSLGLVNHYTALWLPGMISVYNMLILRTNFENISSELDDAARIDGCNEVRLLLQIYIPLSLAVLATLTLFYGVGYWNSFMSVLIFINDSKKYNLAVLVQQMIQSQSALQELSGLSEQVSLTPEGVKTAGIVVMIIPMLMVYPFIQKYFVKGVMIGAVKG